MHKKTRKFNPSNLNKLKEQAIHYVTQNEIRCRIYIYLFSVFLCFFFALFGSLLFRTAKGWNKSIGIYRNFGFKENLALSRFMLLLLLLLSCNL